MAQGVGKPELVPYGEVVTADAGEKVKVNDFKLLLAEREKLITDLETKKKELKEKGGYTETYEDLALAHDELEELIAE
ncbi:5927_t:CDS:2 [Ambispora gerdemannii]|uniref:5927_t:CDS:1 n=1 Tax=Ambispora gerdemannii TaxID=144530 RepID=A0A9N8UYZ1_9GLOM|nr:5927_t:CDS:2 [Ambispora gerdemannii]